MKELVKIGDKEVLVEYTIDAHGKRDPWMDVETMSKFFGKDPTVITRHISNAYKDGEVKNDTFRVTKKIGTVGKHKGREYDAKTYNIDVILSVGYKANGKMAVEFRKWASSVLSAYIKDGYVINKKMLAEKRLSEVFSAIDSLQKDLIEAKKADLDEVGEILSIIRDYGYSFKSLQNYDEDASAFADGTHKDVKYTLDYDSAIRYIKAFKEELIKKGEAKDLFGEEKTHRSLAGILGNVFNVFSWGPAYPSLEEQASHLLYFVIKDHPFNDGNKRIASMLFSLFLDKNNFLRTSRGELKISDGALAGIVITIAKSEPKMKDFYISLLVNALKKQ